MTLHPEFVEIVRRALEEDIGSGDITSRACVPEERRAQGRFIAREQLVLAGIDLLPLIYRLRGGIQSIEVLKRDGAAIESDETVAVVVGSARRLLECERVALNFLQRLSGIATLARKFSDAVEGTGCRVLDTRKTTPGLRRLEKMAAKAGGAVNHRMGLYDAVLIKNNHIAAAGGVRQALENARVYAPDFPAEIEVRTRAELDEALACGATHLLLDNLTPEEAGQWVRLIDGRATVEISGGVTLETARAYAQTGAHFVSVGAITHSAPAADLSFRLELL